MRKYFVVLLALALMIGLGAGNAQAARQGGTFNFCAPYGGDLMTLDCQRTNRVQDFIVTMSIHRGLYKWDADKNMPVLDMAESIVSSEDGLTHTFKLRPNIKFHNGRAVTADDLIWSYERIMDPKVISNGARFIRNVKGAEAFEKGEAKTIVGLKKIDDLTLEITMAQPVEVAYAFYDAALGILPKEEVEKRGDDFGNNPVGCGPFKFVKWVKGSEIILERFDGFYEEGKPYLDKVVYKIMPEGAARDLAFKAKDLDATLVGSSQYPEYKNNPEIGPYMLEVAEMFTRLMGLHPKFEPFSKKEVRQAINYAIDSKLIIKKLLKDKAFPTIGYLPTTSPAFDPNGKGYEYNPAKAKELMKKAGYEKGFTFECLGTTNEAWGTAVLEALIPYLKEINVTIKPVQVEEAVMADQVDQKNDFQAFIWSYESGPSPLNAMQRWGSKNSATAGNSVLYNNPEFDKLLEAAGNERDTAKRMEILKKADAVFTDDAPIWFFNYNKAVMAHQPWVHGMQAVAVEMMYQDLANVWIEESSPRAAAK
ncbi:MAG: ABC transporter substrate-binding protein [Pseudomonadota bacterium]